VVPGVLDRPAGCLFNPRCPNATEHCRRVQPPFGEGPRGRVRCHYPLTAGVPANHPGREEAAA
jgi:dipeptide transport system ATP-binding protein